MAANKEPIFALKPETVLAVITGATTDKSGATLANLVELVTGTTDGTKVTWIKFKHVGSASGGIYLIFITDTSGANPRLFAELTQLNVGSSNTVRTDENTLLTRDLQLKSGQKILVGATTANTNIHVTASVGHYS